jgi:hypothetical protein
MAGEIVERRVCKRGRSEACDKHRNARPEEERLTRHAHDRFLKCSPQKSRFAQLVCNAAFTITIPRNRQMRAFFRRGITFD